MPLNNTLQRFLNRFSRLSRRSTPGSFHVIGSHDNSRQTVAAQLDVEETDLDFGGTIAFQRGSRAFSFAINASDYADDSNSWDDRERWAHNDATFIAWCFNHKKSIRRALYLYAMIGEPTQLQSTRLMSMFPTATGMNFVELINHVEREADNFGRAQPALAPPPVETEPEETETRETNEDGDELGHDPDFEQDGEHSAHIIANAQPDPDVTPAENSPAEASNTVAGDEGQGSISEGRSETAIDHNDPA